MLNESNSFMDSNNNKLKKLDKIRSLFIIPMFLWFFVVLFDFIIYILEIDTLVDVRYIIESIFFYVFPILLIYFVIATFYSSYKILESKNYKNLLSFALFQLIAYFIMNVLKIELPVYDKVTSLILTILCSFIVFIMFYLIQLKIKIPSNDEALSYQLNKDSMANSKPGIRKNESGVFISSMFSIIIASMIYFRVTNGISFVTWGVIFGVILSSLFIDSDKLILSIFYFLEPRGAINLYNIIKLKSEVQDEKDRCDTEREKSQLTKYKMTSIALRLANELEDELAKVQFNKGERKIRECIDILRQSNDLPDYEQSRIVEDIKYMINDLRTKENIPQSIPALDYKTLSLDDKISNLVGLSDKEIEQAISEKKIKENQKHFWSVKNQKAIKIALQDFQNEEFNGTNGIFVAKSITNYFEKNPFFLEKITSILTSSEFDLKLIKGAEEHKLGGFILSSPSKSYSVIIRRGDDGSFLIVGFYERKP